MKRWFLRKLRNYMRNYENWRSCSSAKFPTALELTLWKSRSNFELSANFELFWYPGAFLKISKTGKLLPSIFELFEIFQNFSEYGNGSKLFRKSISTFFVLLIKNECTKYLYFNHFLYNKTTTKEWIFSNFCNTVASPSVDSRMIELFKKKGFGWGAGKCVCTARVKKNDSKKAGFQGLN